jgi:hypothetical protein
MEAAAEKAVEAAAVVVAVLAASLLWLMVRTVLLALLTGREDQREGWVQCAGSVLER